VLAACLAKDPKRRPPLDVVLKEFAQTDFTAASSPPVGGMPATRPAGPIPVPVPPARVGRRALLIGTSVVAGTAALGGMAALHWAGGSGTPGGPHAVAAMAFTQDGKTLVVLGGDGLNTLWRCPVDGGAAQTVRLDTPADGSAVVFSADAKTLVRAEGVTIKLWDTATGHVTSTLKGPNDGFTVSALSPDGTRLAAAAQSHGLQFWDVTAGSVTTTLPAGSDMIGALAFDPESLHVAVGSMDGNTVRIIDARSAQVQATLSEGNSIGSVAFSPDGSTLAIGGNGTRLWDMSANSRSVSLADPTGHDVVVAFAPGGGRLASGSDQGGVTIWDMGARKAVTVLRSARPPMAYGSVLAAVANGKVTLWNVATGRIIRTF
jgi:WD40 repeat protein